MPCATLPRITVSPAYRRKRRSPRSQPGKVRHFRAPFVCMKQERLTCQPIKRWTFWSPSSNILERSETFRRIVSHIRTLRSVRKRGCRHVPHPAVVTRSSSLYVPRGHIAYVHLLSSLSTVNTAHHQPTAILNAATCRLAGTSIFNSCSATLQMPSRTRLLMEGV